MKVATACAFQKVAAGIQQRQHRQMDQHARPADRREHGEAGGDDPPQIPLVQACDEFERHRAIELALACQPLTELHRHLGHAQLPARERENIEQDLEPNPRKARRERADPFGLDHEIAAHRIGQLDPRQQPRQPVGDARAPLSVGARQAPRAAAIGETRCDHEVGLACAQLFEHRRDQRGIVLVVGVHHRDHGGGGGADTLDHGGGKAAPPDAVDHAHPAIGPRQRARLVGGPIGAVVVDHDRFPVEPGQRRVDPRDHRREIFPLVERGQDDGDFGHSLFPLPP